MSGKEEWCQAARDGFRCYGNVSAASSYFIFMNIYALLVLPSTDIIATCIPFLTDFLHISYHFFWVFFFLAFSCDFWILIPLQTHDEFLLSSLSIHIKIIAPHVLLLMHKILHIKKFFISKAIIWVLSHNVTASVWSFYLEFKSFILKKQNPHFLLESKKFYVK